MADTWRSISAQKIQERAKRIPQEWLISASYTERNNTLSVPRECGILTAEELRITENYDATALLAGLANGLLSSTDVTFAFCKRSAIAQQCCNCLTEIFYDDALHRARELDEYFARNGRPIGPLHGLPISLKDCFNVKGFDSSVGYAALCLQPQTENSVLVDLILSLGAVIYCKTNIPQAMASLDSMNNVWGRTLNPRARKLTAGGSSGGEAALVAMRGSILGIGTDVGGSIRVPASCNHIYGIKPSHGRVPYTKLQTGQPKGMAQITLHATAGPLATSMRDCEMFLRIISDSDPSAVDPDVIPQSWISQPPLNRTQDQVLSTPLRIGVIRTDGHVTPLPPIRKLMDDVVKALSANRQIEMVELDVAAFGAASLKALNGMLSTDGGNSFMDTIEKTGEPLAPWYKGRIRRGKDKSVAQIRELQVLRNQLQTQFLKVWREDGGAWISSVKRTSNHAPRVLDAIICPNAPHPTAPIDRWNTTTYTSMFNILDLPAGVIPMRIFSERDLHGELGGKALNGWDEINRGMWAKNERDAFLGAPMDLQVVTPKLTERRLVEAMTVLDEALQPLRAADARASRL